MNADADEGDQAVPERAPKTRILLPGFEDQDAVYLARLRRSMGRAIRDARRRQGKRAKPARVDLTTKQAMRILARQDYRCALTGLRFWSTPERFGPTIPSIDRIDARAGYTEGNVRIVLLGVNALRGCGTDAEMLRIARALIKHEGRRPRRDLRSPARGKLHRRR